MTDELPDFFHKTIANPPEPLASVEEPSPQPTPKRKRIILPYVLFALFILTAMPGPLFFVALFLPGPFQEAKTVIIPRGTSVQEIGRLLDKNEILIHPILFRGMARMMAQNNLQAGEYRFEPGQSVVEVTAMLRDGKTIIRQVTVPEGLTSTEVVALLREVPELTGDVGKTPEEGALLPETYRYSYGDTRTSVLERMQKDQRELLRELWDKRTIGLPLSTPQEALILASIVEKETGKMAAERPRVAGVFFNRLRQKMPLQTDPTVIYALTNGTAALGRNLTKADLGVNSPYNTYLNPGLPPGPISNPGRAAIEAVLHPETNDYLYFVADGTGGHAFAKTLDEHNKNVARWLSLNRP